jgi:hypothetical protein
MKCILKNESFVTLTTPNMKPLVLIITKVQYDKIFQKFVSIFCTKEQRSSRQTKDAIILVTFVLNFFQSDS